MFKQKENRYNILSSSIIIVLFFLFVCAFSKSSERPVNSVVSYELLTKAHSNQIALNNVQQYASPKINIPIVNKLNYKLYSPVIKVTSDDFLINQKFAFLKQIQLQIKPILLIRFYHSYYTDSESLPILS